MFIKSVVSDRMTLLYTYLAIYFIYNCAKNKYFDAVKTNSKK